MSYLLDGLDGIAARALNQTSKLGLYLDMVIDRVSSSLALHIAAQQARVLFPGQAGALAAAALYAALVLVEVVSHGVVMYKSEMGGFHQKEMESKSWFVRKYLDDKRVLFWSCLSFEVVSLTLVVSRPLWATPFLPGFVFRAIANVIRLRDIMVYAKPVEGATGGKGKKSK